MRPATSCAMQVLYHSYACFAQSDPSHSEPLGRFTLDASPCCDPLPFDDAPMSPPDDAHQYQQGLNRALLEARDDVPGLGLAEVGTRELLARTRRDRVSSA